MRIALYVIGGIVTAIGLLEFMEARGLADIANAGVILICGVVILVGASVVGALDAIRKTLVVVPVATAREGQVGVQLAVRQGQA